MNDVLDILDRGRNLLTNVPTVSINLTLDVRQRLRDLQRWDQQWKQIDGLLLAGIGELDGGNPVDAMRAVSMDMLRGRLEWQRLRAPLEVTVDEVKEIGFAALRQHLVQQFAGLTQAEKLLWLTNFTFIMTPDLRAVTNKITNILGWRALGQQRCFLLGGQSGMGKSTFLRWLASHAIATVEQERNLVPFILVDAPRHSQSSKALPQRMIHACGRTYLARGSEEDLLAQLTLYTRQCGTVLLGVDEVEHIKTDKLRRQLLDISNRIRLPIVCASVDPKKWAEGDSEVEGRWNDYHELKVYTGVRLRSLLAFIELLLPFPDNSHLTSDPVAKLVQRWTKGTLREIMMLLFDASTRAINRNYGSLTPELLKEAWDAIQEEPGTIPFPHE